MLRTSIPVVPRLQILPLFSFSSKSVSSKMSSTQSQPIKLPRFVSAPQVNVTNPDDGVKLSLVSYNILAQAYVKSSLFPHSPSSCLKWKGRSQAILSVLKGLGADFLCLQEIWRGMVIPVLTFREVGKSETDVEFFTSITSELVMEEIIDYNDLVDSIHDGKVLGVDIQYDKAKISDSKSKGNPDHGNPNDPCVKLKRDCVGLIAAFMLKKPSRDVVIVANTHIYWDPDWVDVKLAQVKYLLSHLARFKRLVADKFQCSPSLILSGDFNSTPGDKVYQYLISGNPSSPPTPDALEDLPLPLCSVYASTRGEPPFTNYTPGFTGTLDYIFFSPSDHIQPVSFLELPEPDSSDITGGLPNSNYPSDHLPIGAEFLISRD